MNLNHLKRKLVSGLLAGTLLLGMTGVSTVNAATSSASDYLKQMNKSLSKVESYTAKQTMPLDYSMTMKMDKQKKSTKLKTTTTSTQTTINKPDFKANAVTKISTNIDGEKQTTAQKMYMKKDKKGNIICYSFFDDSKTPIKTTVKASQMNQVIQSVDVSMLTNAKIIDKNYTLNNKKVMKISAELTGSSLKKAMKNLLKMDGLPQDEEIQKLTEQLLDFSKVKPVKYIYYIDPKTNLPVKCTADMKDFLDTYMQSMLTNLLNSDLMKTEETSSMDIKVNVTKANMSITYTDYNQTKEIKFPSSCK